MIVREFVCNYGVPLEIHTDQGSNYESKLFYSMCDILGIKKTRSSVQHPRANGQVERFNHSLKQMLAMFVSENQRDWCEWLPLVMMAYRSTPHSTTKLTPNSLMFGREFRLPVDLVVGRPEVEERNRSVEEYEQKLRQNLEIAHNVARKAIGKDAKYQKRHFDSRIKEKALEPGSFVYLYDSSKKKGLSYKIGRKWKGPYLVLSRIGDVNYEIQLNRSSKAKIAHRDRLRICKNPSKRSWLRIKPSKIDTVTKTSDSAPSLHETTELPHLNNVENDKSADNGEMSFDSPREVDGNRIFENERQEATVNKLSQSAGQVTSTNSISRSDENWNIWNRL